MWRNRKETPLRRQQRKLWNQEQARMMRRALHVRQMTEGLVEVRQEEKEEGSDAKKTTR